MGLLFFWKTGVGGSAGVGTIGGTSTVTGVGASTGGIPVSVSGIRLMLLVELGLGNNGTSLRRTLINQENVVGCYTHSELTTEFGSRDISGLNNHGVYEGTGWIQGITVDDLAEGGIATRFGGGQQIRIANDGLNVGRNLSFAGGDFDIFIYFRTSIVDTNQRGMVTKYHENSGTGYYTYLRNGNLVGGLRIAGVEIFEVESGFVANGLWKRGHLCYTGGVAQWKVNGVNSGASDSAVLEPVPNAADVIIGGWSHLSVPTTRFIGDMHYVLLGREGKATLGTEAEFSIGWTDISDDVTALDVNLGDKNLTPLGSTAGTGTAKFKVKNQDPVGRYSLGHVNARSGLDLSNPVRIRTFDGTTIRPLFRGFISDINPTTGINNERQTAIDCVDWMEVPAVSPVGAIPIVLNQSSGYCIRRLMDTVNRPPAAVDIDLGNEVFPTAFDQVDGEQGKILQEIAECVYNEGGAFHVNRDGTVTFESRQRRQFPTTPVATLFGDWQDMQVGVGLHDVINLQRATVYPREYGDTVTAVVSGTVSPGSTARRQRLVPGTSIPIQGSYQDPEERATSVGATDVQPLIPGVDYTMTENEDGSGIDLTSFVEFVSGNPPQSGSTYQVEVSNTHATLIGWFHMQVRGRIIRRFGSQSTFYKDPDSENKYLPREPPTLNLRYLSEITAGRSRCQYMVNLYKTPKMRPRVFTTMLDPHSTIMTNFLDFELGKLVNISELVTGISNVGYWIQALTYSFRENNICTMTVSVVPSSITGPVFIVGDPTLGVVGTAVVGY